MSQELRLVAILDLKDNSWEHIKSAITHCVQETRKEVGNHYYCANFDQNNQNRIVFIEHWADKNALDLHCQSQHFLQLVETVSPYLTNPMDLINLIEIHS